LIGGGFSRISEPVRYAGRSMDASGSSELSARAVAVGLVAGCLIGASNLVVGLKIGITFGATLTTAVLAFAIFRALDHAVGRGFSAKENVISATSGSAAAAMASAAGLISAVPALGMLGTELTYLELVLWAVSISSLGVLFTVPLRRSMLLHEKLSFPTGNAAAQTISAMFASQGEALARARLLLWSALGAAGLTLLFNLKFLGLGAYQNLGLDDLGISLAVAGVPLAALRFGISFSPMLWGAGALVGPRVGWSLLGGSLLVWGVGAVALLSSGIVTPATPGKEYKAVFEWLLWPGVTIMVCAGLTALALRYKTILRSMKLARRKTIQDGGEIKDAPGPVNTGAWLSGMVAASTLVVIMAWWLFDITPWMGVLALVFSFVVCTISIRAVGETDVNPSGPMAKMTQVVYGLLAPGQISTNLMTAALTKAGASQAADMMSDFKTGLLLGVSVRRQLMAQLLGVFAGVLSIVAVYMVLTGAYDVPGPDFSGPSVQSWYAVAKVLSEGLSSLPAGTAWAVLIAAGLGVGLTLAGRSKRIGRWIPSPVALGIACLIRPQYSVSLWLGALLANIWARKNPGKSEKFGPALAAGLIAGEGITMVLVAILLISGVGWV